VIVGKHDAARVEPLKPLDPRPVAECGIVDALLLTRAPR
jgi:hypothetical protein